MNLQSWQGTVIEENHKGPETFWGSGAITLFIDPMSNEVALTSINDTLDRIDHNIVHWETF